VRQWAGPAALVGPRNRWTLGSEVGFSKLFSTGALLTAAFANNTVINFLRPPGTSGVSSVSTVNLDLIQPFLRGGGRAVTLEPLTQVERNLVYDVRDYAHFREAFFVDIAGGGDLPFSTALVTGTPTRFVPGQPASGIGAAIRTSVPLGAS